MLCLNCNATFIEMSSRNENTYHPHILKISPIVGDITSWLSVNRVSHTLVYSQLSIDINYLYMYSNAP